MHDNSLAYNYLNEQSVIPMDSLSESNQVNCPCNKEYSNSFYFKLNRYGQRIAVARKMKEK